MTNKELLNTIEEELQGFLDERCQKGYKTHPTTKTKKMYGKTYRNCVKADEAKEEPDNLKEEEITNEQLKAAIRKVLGKEGGAAGMKALKKQSNSPEKDIKKTIEDDPKVGQHPDGDYILAKGKVSLSEIVEEEIDLYLEKKKKKTDYSKEKKSGLHGWFSRAGGKGKSKGWVDCNTCRKGKGGRKTCKSCGRGSDEKRAKYPHCRPTPSDCGTSKKSGKKSKAGKKG